MCVQVILMCGSRKCEMKDTLSAKRMDSTGEEGKAPGCQSE